MDLNQRPKDYESLTLRHQETLLDVRVLASPLQIAQNGPMVENGIQRKTVTTTVTKRFADLTLHASHAQLDALVPEQNLRLDKIEYGGSLEARRLKSGKVVFYWRYTQEGKTERVPIGAYDSSAPPKSLKPSPRGVSIAAAREIARELSKKNAELPGGFRAEAKRTREAQEAETEARSDRARYSLEVLCSEYCSLLEKLGKGSHREAQLLFNKHVIGPQPTLARTPACEVEKKQLIEPLRKLTEAGKQSTARKLRSYLRAAYACALRADSDPAIPECFIGFNVTVNPVEGIAAVRSRADKRPLSLQELSRYWQALRRENTLAGAALRAHLLAGGQRIAQLVRLRAEDLTKDAMKIKDLKGRRSEPRVHLVPITPPLRSELRRLSTAGYVFSTDNGQTPMHPTSLTAWSREIAKRAKLDDFQLKRVRSGVETALASAGVPPHVRGQLQSHGIGGVQATHYDAHEYLPEKRSALETLHKLLHRARRIAHSVRAYR